jgi:hypothetical protein
MDQNKEIVVRDKGGKMKIKEQKELVLPVIMRENRPTNYSILIMNNRPDGLPDGVHCGAWQDAETGKVWKSLYGRPFINAEVIVRTQEDEFLAEFADLFYFPKNWEVKQSNNLSWLVRDEAITLAPEEYKDLDNETILDIEQVIYKVNDRGWAINDYIALLIDKKTYNLFIGDLSCAYPDKEADDWIYIEKFFNLCLRENLVKLRNNASHVLHELRYETIMHKTRGEAKEIPHEELMQYKHIYASFNRPISGNWANLEGTLYRHCEPSWGQGHTEPWTWVVTKEPLGDSQVKSYELQWGWSDHKIR